MWLITPHAAHGPRYLQPMAEGGSVASGNGAHGFKRLCLLRLEAGSANHLPTPAFAVKIMLR